MRPLYQDPGFTFRFAEDRRIPRFHLEGVDNGRHVSIIKIDSATGERQGLLAFATVGEDGWVDLPQPLIVKAGEAFIAVPTCRTVQQPGLKVMIASLCESCRNMREVCTARSRFLLCELSVSNPDFRKYPPQPVLRCEGYQATATTHEEQR